MVPWYNTYHSSRRYLISIVRRRRFHRSAAAAQHDHDVGDSHEESPPKTISTTVGRWRRSRGGGFRDSELFQNVPERLFRT